MNRAMPWLLISLLIVPALARAEEPAATQPAVTRQEVGQLRQEQDAMRKAPAQLRAERAATQPAARGSFCPFSCSSLALSGAPTPRRFKASPCLPAPLARSAPTTGPLSTPSDRQCRRRALRWRTRD